MAHAASPGVSVRAPRTPIPTWSFALVIVGRDHRFRGFPLDLLGAEMSV